MADDNYVVIRIELLMRPARYVSHGDQFRVGDLGQFEFPGLADVEQRKLTALISESF